MDGTLIEGNIDYADMRQRTGIPQGDLFTVMESWDEGDRIKSAMDIIVSIETGASETISKMDGLLEVLNFVREKQVSARGYSVRSVHSAVSVGSWTPQHFMQVNCKGYIVCSACIAHLIPYAPCRSSWALSRATPPRAWTRSFAWSARSGAARLTSS